MIQQQSALGPAQFLVDNVDLLPMGRALDVAMGEGRNAIYLARLGFTVEGVDISPVAVAKALAAARSAGVEIAAQVADLEDGYEIAPGAYDVILVFRYLQRSLFPALVAGLRPGGVIVYETYIAEQAQLSRPRNPAHLLEHNELLHAFADLRVLRYREGLVDGRYVAGIIALREADTSGCLYTTTE